MNRSGLIVLLVSCAIGALATTTPLHIGVTNSICDEYGRVLQGSAIAPGCLVEALWATNGVVYPPNTNGMPHTDNAPVLNGVSAIGACTARSSIRSGLFSMSIAVGRPGNGDQIFVRVFNAPTRESSSFYADSEIFQVNENDVFIAHIPDTMSAIDTNDSDGDGISNSREESLGSNPYTTDSDGDEQSDAMEYAVGSDMTSSSSWALIWYSMDETNGVDVVNQVDTNANGIVEGTFVRGVAGYETNAYYWPTGICSAVRSTELSITGSFSVSLWIKLNAGSYSNTALWSIGKTNSNPYTGLHWNRYTDGGGVSGRFSFVDTTNVMESSFVELMTDSWHLVSVVVDAVVQTDCMERVSSIYIDGILLNRFAAYGVTSSVVGGVLRAGCTPSGGYAYSGAMDEFQVYQGALTGPQLYRLADRLDATAQYQIDVTEGPGGRNVSSMYVAAGTVFSCELTNTQFETGTTRYHAFGWTREGVMPVSQASLDAGWVSVTNSMSICWLWRTSCWVEVDAASGGIVEGDSGWYAIPTTAVFSAVATNDAMRFSHWSGNVPANIAEQNPLQLPVTECMQLSAVFTDCLFSVQLVTNGCGRLTATPEAIDYGASCTISIVPDSHYQMESIMVDGNAHPLTNTVVLENVVSNHSVSVSFAPVSYTLTVQAQDGSDGTTVYTNIYESQLNLVQTNTVLQNGKTQLVCVGWVLDEGTYTGEGASIYYSEATPLLVTNDVTVRWIWATNYLVDVYAHSNGVVNTTGGWFRAGSVVELYAYSTNEAYTFGSWSNAGQVEQSEVYEVSVNSPSTWWADFMRRMYSLRVYKTGEGWIAPLAGTVYYGASTSVYIEADSYYELGAIDVNGTPRQGVSGLSTNLSFDDVRTNIDITVLFDALVTTNCNVPLWWLASYGLTNDFEEAAGENSDQDEFLNWEEWIAGTDPTNESSFFMIERCRPLFGAASHCIEWQAVEGRTYKLYMAETVSGAYEPLVTNLVADTTGMLCYTNYVEAAASSIFYRVHVSR